MAKQCKLHIVSHELPRGAFGSCDAVALLFEPNTAFEFAKIRLCTFDRFDKLPSAILRAHGCQPVDSVHTDRD